MLHSDQEVRHEVQKQSYKAVEFIKVLSGFGKKVQRELGTSEDAYLPLWSAYVAEDLLRAVQWILKQDK